MAHTYSLQRFPGHFTEVIQLVPRGSFPALPFLSAAGGNRNSPCALSTACQPAGMGQGSWDLLPVAHPSKVCCLEGGSVPSAMGTWCCLS